MNMYEVILERINDLAPGQILSYFNFYQVQEENSFNVFKSDKDIVLFVYKSPNENLSFVENVEFKTLDKVGLFFFLSGHTDKESIIHTINEIVDIEEFYRFSFTESITDKRILDAYFSLERTQNFAHTPISEMTFSRFGRDCVLFYKDEKAIDVVVFDESESIVYSEFGNNFGYHRINKDSSDLVITYNPGFLTSHDYDNYDILLTKYYYSDVDIIKQVLSKTYKTVSILSIDETTSYFKLKVILTFLNFIRPGINFNMKQSPNNQFNEITFFFSGDLKEKVKITNEISSIQRIVKKEFVDAPGQLQEIIQNHFKITISFASQEDHHCGSVLFKNTKDLNEVFINFYLDDINEHFEELKFV